MSLVPDPDNIRLAVLGMVDGNGHPFSWSAIINGSYDADAMADCGYPVIPQYLGAQPPGALGIPGAKVTHVACDNYDDACHIAKASHIPNIVQNPEDVIGHVDAVIIATDIGGEHVRRATPFFEAGLPVYIDKPLADSSADLKTFMDWKSEGKHFLSASCMRYAREYRELRDRLPAIGTPKLITVTMVKSWERYGIHALEAVYPLLEPYKYETVTHAGSSQRNIVHLTHASGADVVLAVIYDLVSAFGHVQVYGSEGSDGVRFADTFFAFKSQLEAFVQYLRTGDEPYPFEETIEQMKIVIAGIKSREQNGATISLSAL